MTIALENVVAVVTGAAGGIGRGIVTAMKAAGATVIATDRAAPEGTGADHAMAHDVTNPADWQAVADYVQATHGRLDALVNNAGISLVTKFEDTPLSEWHRVNAVNVDSIVIGTQTLLPLLKEGGKARASGASVVNFSSIGGLRGAPFNAVYCASKAAVAMITKCTGAEFAALKYNIRVNSVHPGGIETAMLNSIFDRYLELGAASSREEILAGMYARHPIGRLGRPEEMSGGVVFLCSDASSFMTCDELVMDGGYCMV